VLKQRDLISKGYEKHTSKADGQMPPSRWDTEAVDRFLILAEETEQKMPKRQIMR